MPWDLIGAIGGVISMVGFLAMAVAKWRTASDETITRLLRDERDLYRDKAERLEKALGALEQRVTSLEQENRTLRALHDSRQEMATLRQVMTEGFTTLAAALKKGR